MAQGYSTAVPIGPMPDAGRFPALAAAVVASGHVVKQEWMRLAAGPAVNRLTGSYIAGLRRANSYRYPYQGDDFAVGIFNVSRHASLVEYGHPAYNLAARIRWGQTPKAKRSKKGGWYLLIPFRHYTPVSAGQGASPGRVSKSMPRAIYEAARRMQPGERLTGDARRIHTASGPVGRTTRPVGVRGTGIGGGKYVLPTRTRALPHMKRTAKSARSLGAATAAGEAPDPRHAKSIYDGMFKAGSKGHSQYMTIRAITPNSQWWIPHRPGAYVARKTQANTRNTVTRLITEGFKHDVERTMAQVLAS